MRKVIDEKVAQQGKLQFEVECASTAEEDVECLMVRVASLEKELAQVRRIEACPVRSGPVPCLSRDCLRCRGVAAVPFVSVHFHEQHTPVVVFGGGQKWPFVSVDLCEHTPYPCLGGGKWLCGAEDPPCRCSAEKTYLKGTRTVRCGTPRLYDVANQKTGAV